MQKAETTFDQNASTRHPPIVMAKFEKMNMDATKMHKVPEESKRGAYDHSILNLQISHKKSIIKFEQERTLVDLNGSRSSRHNQKD